MVYQYIIYSITQLQSHLYVTQIKLMQEYIISVAVASRHNVCASVLCFSYGILKLENYIYIMYYIRWFVDEDIHVCPQMRNNVNLKEAADIVQMVRDQAEADNSPSTRYYLRNDIACMMCC